MSKHNSSFSHHDTESNGSELNDVSAPEFASLFPVKIQQLEVDDEYADDTASQHTSDENDSDDDSSYDDDDSSCVSSDTDANEAPYSEDEGTMVEDLGADQNEKNGLFLSLEMVQLLRLNTSEGNIFTGNPVFENLVPKTVTRRSSEGGGATGGIVYAVQTKSAVESHPGYESEVVSKPKEVITKLLESRGLGVDATPYSSLTSWVKGCAANYNLTLMEAVRRDDIEIFRSMYASGCNLQCANKWGETIIHAVARYGRIDILQFLVETADVSMNVCCDGGRTILHDACWTVNPNWKCISYILRRLPGLLFIADKRGFTPLEYVPKDAWADWKIYLESNEHLFFTTEYSE